MTRKPYLMTGRTSTTAEPTDAIIVLGGSFSPLHSGHLACLEAGKRNAEKKGLRVVAGYMAVAHDTWVRAKFAGRGEDQKYAFDVKARLRMCNDVAESIEWLRPTPEPFGSANECGRAMVKLNHTPNRTRVITVKGSDMTLSKTPDGATISSTLVRKLMGSGDKSALARLAAEGVLPRQVESALLAVLDRGRKAKQPPAAAAPAAEAPQETGSSSSTPVEPNRLLNPLGGNSRRPPPLQRLPSPIDYMGIALEDKTPSGSQIGYTDCMESSCLRFMQAMLCDATSLDANGRPTRVDLDLVNRRVKYAEVKGYFAEFPAILPEREYNSGKGFMARQAWSRLVTHRPFFTYKRSACGVYKNEYFSGETPEPERGGHFKWELEMEPCVHNVISLCRNFLGVDFAQEDKQNPMWRLPQGCHTNHEAFTHDVSNDAMPHLTAAMRQLSRPGFMVVQAHVIPPSSDNGDPSTDIIFEVNLSQGCTSAWRWRCHRRFVNVSRALFKELSGRTEQQMAGVTELPEFNARNGSYRMRTSWHSSIEAIVATQEKKFGYGLWG